MSKLTAEEYFEQHKVALYCADEGLFGYYIDKEDFLKYSSQPPAEVSASVQERAEKLYSKLFYYFKPGVDPSPLAKSIVIKALTDAITGATEKQQGVVKWPGITKEDHTLIAQIMIDYNRGVAKGGHPLDIAIGLIDNVYKASVEATPSTENQQGGDLINAYKEYVELLVGEIESLVGFAYVHGWRSTRHEQSKVLREKISSLSATHTKAAMQDNQQPSLSREQVREKKDEGHGMCVECNQSFVTKDYNGHNYWVCDTCFDRLSDDFEEVYK